MQIAVSYQLLALAVKLSIKIFHLCLCLHSFLVVQVQIAVFCIRSFIKGMLWKILMFCVPMIGPQCQVWAFNSWGNSYLWVTRSETCRGWTCVTCFKSRKGNSNWECRESSWGDGILENQSESSWAWTQHTGIFMTSMKYMHSLDVRSLVLEWSLD